MPPTGNPVGNGDGEDGERELTHNFEIGLGSCPLPPPPPFSHLFLPSPKIP